MNNREKLLNFWIPLAFRFSLAAVFLIAGAPKILHPDKFALDIANYRLLPHEWNNLLAITLPWVEVVAGILLAAGIWVRASAWAITGMMVMFVVVISYALARGLNIECGCFGTVAGRRIGLTSLVLDLVLLFMAVWLSWRSPEKPAQPTTPMPARQLDPA